MAGPWERFQTQQDGPWNKFAAEKKTDPYAEVAQEQSATQNFLAGMGGAMQGLYLGGKQMLGFADQSDVDSHKAAMKGLGTTTSGTAGQFAGVAIPAAATALVPGANTLTGAALTGAVFGALEPVSKDESRLQNAAIGGVAGSAGQKIASAIGRFNKPVQSTLNQDQQRLAQVAISKGIDLDAAQLTGSKPLMTVKSVMGELPFTAGREAEKVAAQNAAWNRAIAEKMGESADLITPNVMGDAKSRIGKTLNDLGRRNAVYLDDAFTDAVSAIEAKQTPFSKGVMGGHHNPGLIEKARMLKTDAEKNGGWISGEVAQNVRSALSAEAQGAKGSKALALKQLKSAFEDAIDRSVAQPDRAVWDAARGQYKVMKTVEKAMANDASGNLMPGKFAQSVKSSDPNAFSYGHGDTDLADLARIGVQYINDRVPNSGTAQRAFYQRLIENPLTAIWQQGIGGMALPLQAAINSQAGKRYFTQGLLDVNPTLARIGKSAVISAPVGLLQFAE